MDLKEVINRSIKIREQYHKLENEYHGSEWFIEEDALAFLTDAGLVGRLTMDNQSKQSYVPIHLGSCFHHLEILNFIFELVFCMYTSMGQGSMHRSKENICRKEKLFTF